MKIDRLAREAGDVAERSVEFHWARRWGALVGPVLSCPHDLTTVRAWAREAGTCETQLRLRCRLAGVTAKISLDVVRVLRAACWREIRGGTLTDYLDFGDPRTRNRLLARAGLDTKQDFTPLEYVGVQTIIKDGPLVEELTRILIALSNGRDYDRPHH